MFTPLWKEYEDKLRTGTADSQRQALDAFMETREKEMESSQKARDFETSRRAEMAKLKPEYTRKRIQKEQEGTQQIIKELKNGGEFESDMTPMGGYVIVELEKPETVTESGIYLGEATDIEPNTGRIIACGNSLIMEKNILPCPVEAGDRVLFKKFAGMDILVKGRTCRLMQFTDLLAKFND